MRGGDVSHKQDLESPFPTGVTLTLLREGLDEMFACPVESDNSTAHVCILGSGPDRVGHVAKVGIHSVLEFSRVLVFWSLDLQTFA